MSTVQQTTHDPLVIADRTFASRLLLGTGGFQSLEAMADAITERTDQPFFRLRTALSARKTYASVFCDRVCAAH